MTFAQAFHACRELGYSLTRTPYEEFKLAPRLNGRDPTRAILKAIEDAAYYTNDLEDAVATCKLMAGVK
jgi:hypothetical protein